MQATWQQFKDDLPTFGLLAVLVTLSSAAVGIAGWTEGLRGLTALALVGLLAGTLLARSAFSPLTAFAMATTYGGFAVWLQQVLALRGDLPLQERSLVLVQRLAAWTLSAVGGGFNQDNLVFVVLLAILYWYLACGAAWNMFRLGRLWPAVIPSGIALLVNVAYYAGSARLDLMLLAYLFAALLLAVRTNVAAREALWRDRNMLLARGVRGGLLRAGILASAALLAVAWLAPTAPASARLASAWDRAISPRFDLRETWDRLFSLEGATVAAPADYYGGQTLTLGGSINFSDTPVMDVHAPFGPRYYWRSKVFDTFDGRMWTTTSDARLRSDFGVLYFEDAGYDLRRNVRQRFQMQIPASRLVYGAAQPSSVSLPVSFDVLFIDPNQQRGSLTSLRAENLLRNGDAYEVISNISYADEGSLRAAGTAYPGWVLRTYLQVPDTTTQRTRDLASQLVSSQATAFDGAQAVEGWLRENVTYNEGISAPPPDVDAVDWLLFEHREGYCNYYASAMVVMLRSQDIPSRIATGFASGEFNARSGAYQVVESDAHAWVEVYFPGYGWVEFEPTAARPAIGSRGDPEATLAAGAAAPDEAPQPVPTEPAVADLPAPGADASAVPATTAPSRGFAPVVLVVLFVVSVSILAGGVLGWREARRRGLHGLSGVARAYALLNVLAGWLGIHLSPSHTPNERAAALGVEVPEAAAPVHEIAALYVRERYAVPHSSDDPRTDVGPRASAAWQRARPHFVRRVIRRILRLR